MVYEDGSRPLGLHPESWVKDLATIDDLFRENFICTCTVMFRNGLFGRLPAWHQETVPGDWAIHILNAHYGPIGYIPEVLADYRIHAQGLWSKRSLAERHADVLRMLSKVDWHFHGRYTSQIDDYRIGIVTYLANSLEMASSHAASLETKRRIRRDRRAQWLALRAWRWTKRRFERGLLSLSLPAEPQRA